MKASTKGLFGFNNNKSPSKNSRSSVGGAGASVYGERGGVGRGDGIINIATTAVTAN